MLYAYYRHMKEEITSASRLVELNEHNSDNEMKDTVDLKNNELNKDNVENEKEETRKVEDKVEDACVGMLFGSIDDIMEYFTRYGNKKGFAVVKRTSRKGNDGEVESLTVTCNRAEMQQIKASNSLKAQPQSKTEYEIREDGAFGENSEHATFLVYFNKDTNEVNCNCRFFEFRGILCRHQITVLFHMKIDQVPNKYILKRWCNNIKRSHTKVRINYDNRLVKPKTQRFDKMYKVFNEVADLAVDSDDKCEKVVARILELKGEFKQEKLVCGSNEPIFAGILTNSTSCGDDLAISKETKNILGPVMELELQQSQQIGKESYEESTTWPNINCPPNIIGMSPYYGLPNMLQGGNSPFQSSMIRQVVGMQPFSYHENTSQDDSPLHKACYDLSNEHPSNSIGKFGTNDVTKFGNPKLHEDGRGN
nr:isoform 2 of protein far1-related sequence 2 [Quercus suber]